MLQHRTLKTRTPSRHDWLCSYVAWTVLLTFFTTIALKREGTVAEERVGIFEARLVVFTRFVRTVQNCNKAKLSFLCFVQRKNKPTSSES